MTNRVGHAARCRAHSRPTFRSSQPCCTPRPTAGVPLAYLDNAATTQRPRQVIEAIVDVYEQHYANVHRGIHWLSDQSTDLYEEAREQGAGVHRRRRAAKRSSSPTARPRASTWWPAVGATRTCKPGDEILLTEMEHHSNIVPWQQLAARTGRGVRLLPITDDGQLAARRARRAARRRARGSSRSRPSPTCWARSIRSSRSSPRPTRPARWCWSTRRRACRTSRPTCRRWAPTSWPSAATRCSGPPAWACSTAAASCSRRCRRSWAAAA